MYHDSDVVESVVYFVDHVCNVSRMWGSVFIDHQLPHIQWAIAEVER